MKGLIVYSSKTGNAKAIAERIYNGLEGSNELKLLSESEYRKFNQEGYDFAIIGGWVDRAKLNKGILKLVRNTSIKKVGLFATLGAMPDSDHGKDVACHLERELEGFDSLGYSVMPGLVDKAILEKMQSGNWKIKMIPKAVRELMIETGLNSRMPTDEEYEACVDVFRKGLEK